MHKLAILVVTYIKDLEYVERLVKSYKKYNVDRIPLYLVVPESDRKAFEKFSDNDIELLILESITTTWSTTEASSASGPDTSISR